MLTTGDQTSACRIAGIEAFVDKDLSQPRKMFDQFPNEQDDISAPPEVLASVSMKPSLQLWDHDRSKIHPSLGIHKGIEV